MKNKSTYWVGKNGKEYPKDEYTNHGYGGVKNGKKDLPKEGYPYTLKYEDSKLYKPINHFKWQDATKKEMQEESIPHYAQKFPL